MKLYCVHGLGGHTDGAWKGEWTAAVSRNLPQGTTAQFVFCEYDPIFAAVDLSLAETTRALLQLAWSGITSPFRRARRAQTLPERVHWTAGYIVAWLADEGFRRQTREKILREIGETAPDMVLAHSLGSLLVYDALTHRDAQGVAGALRGTQLVTFGSQLGNPFVTGNLTLGRIAMPPVRQWTHLFNPADDVFTSRLRLSEPRFREIDTLFDTAGVGDHRASDYLGHTAAATLWQGPRTRSLDAPAPPRPPVNRALLVGIDAYPKEADRLEGCVNDVFTMSAVLQECGIDPAEIRTCLDERATGEAILDRLGWLTEDVQPGDRRIFYYSGHGACIPEYGVDLEPDHLTETLVPWDFDWSPAKAVSDEQICKLYSQLPYDAYLMMIFDCCHSGGIHRLGGTRARGITPPDDVRHRQLKWDLPTKMWVDRDFARLNPGFGAPPETDAAFFGDRGATLRLGRAGLLRQQPADIYDAAKATAQAPVGPYLPIILEACREEQLSYEYRHGATSYGAFTFCLASILRETPGVTFRRLVELTAARLKDLGYAQDPTILGPAALLDKAVPLNTGTSAPTGLPGGSTPPTSG